MVWISTMSWCNDRFVQISGFLRSRSKSCCVIIHFEFFLTKYLNFRRTVVRIYSIHTLGNISIGIEIDKNTIYYFSTRSLLLRLSQHAQSPWLLYTRIYLLIYTSIYISEAVLFEERKDFFRSSHYPSFNVPTTAQSCQGRKRGSIVYNLTHFAGPTAPCGTLESFYPPRIPRLRLILGTVICYCHKLMAAF